MPTVDITEYDKLASDQHGNVILAGQEPSRGTQQVSITAGSVQSTALRDTTRFVRIHTDGAVRVAFGTNPTAAGSSQRMAANSTEFFGVQPGTKIAVIQTT